MHFSNVPAVVLQGPALIPRLEAGVDDHAVRLKLFTLDTPVCPQLNNQMYKNAVTKSYSLITATIFINHLHSDPANSPLPRLRLAAVPCCGPAHGRNYTLTDATRLQRLTRPTDTHTY